MARRGGFAGSLNPFGMGSLGGLGAYNIGQSLADLAIYEAEIGWGNGTVSDADYLAALQKGVDVTDQNSHARVSAVNKLQDAQYQIGREKASLAGLDQTIAFDQTSLTTMNPDNLKYRTIQQNLAAELAQRRSRDYGKLVTSYNAGHSSTQSLLDWVNATIAALPAGAPDTDNWTQVKTDLGTRIQTEKDAQVYQDYQHQRIKGPAFLAYIKGRRDSFDPNSPDYASWTNKLEDATKSVNDNAQAVKDQAFFDKYNNGHASDKQYLAYLSNRIHTMDPSDPSLPQWKQRLTQAAHSIAEDELRFAVQTGKRPVSDLVAFYQHYRTTLNPNSPDYRQVTRNIMALTHSAGGGGGGGGGGSRKGKVTVGGDPALGIVPGPGNPNKTNVEAVGYAKGVPKAISPSYTLDTVLHLMTVNPYTDGSKAGKRNQKAALDAFNLNFASLQNAVQRGDDTWAFFDPRKKLGSKPTMLPTSGTALANMNQLKEHYYSGLAGVAMANKDAQGYYKALRQASDAHDAARVAYGHAVLLDDGPLFKQKQAAIDLAMTTGDWTTAINLGYDLHARLNQDMHLPGLDDTKRAALQAMIDTLDKNALLPTDDAGGTKPSYVRGADLANATVTTDAQGHKVYTDVPLSPGYHLVMGTGPLNEDGTPPWKLAHDDLQDGSWEEGHVTVQASYGGRLVTADVAKVAPEVDPLLVVNAADQRLGPGGTIKMGKPPAGMVQSIAYTDANGQIVRAYSVDGQTWIRPEPGQSVPVLTLDTGALVPKDNGDGTQSWYVDGTQTDSTAKPVYTDNADGSVTFKNSFISDHPEYVDFIGVADAKAEAKAHTAHTPYGDIYLTPKADTIGVARDSLATAKGKPAANRNLDLNQGPAYEGLTSVGAVGQRMTVIEAGTDGSINMIPAAPPTLADWKVQQSLTTDERPRPVGDALRAQMPVGTPPRYDGVGLSGNDLSRGGFGAPPLLRPVTMPGITTVPHAAPKPIILGHEATKLSPKPVLPGHEAGPPLPKPKPIPLPKPVLPGHEAGPPAAPHAGAL